MVGTPLEAGRLGDLVSFVPSACVGKPLESGMAIGATAPLANGGIGGGMNPNMSGACIGGGIMGLGKKYGKLPGKGNRGLPMGGGGNPEKPAGFIAPASSAAAAAAAAAGACANTLVWLALFTRVSISKLGDVLLKTLGVELPTNVTGSTAGS